MSATAVSTQASDARPVIRCASCSLVQFETVSQACRRCHKAFFPPEPEPVAEAPKPRLRKPVVMLPMDLAGNLRARRLELCLSQSQLALRMAVPRTYVSKIENRKATPTLSSLERFAKALETPIGRLVMGGSTEQETLLADPLLRELVPLVGKLSPQHRAELLSTVEQIAITKSMNKPSHVHA